ncbi:MAG: DNA alkylation repair protein [Acidimicrobiia bacterium]|nr:DNA alkylation repair protein [Acidimicrobiia bacterium]
MPEPLKNMVDREVVEDIARRIAAADGSFDPRSFIDDVMAELPDLELKPRIEAIARRIAAGLSDDYRDALHTVVAVAKAEPPIGGFAAWPLCTFVEVFGVDDPEASLPAMEHLTKRASCEFAIRPFLRDHWDQAYAHLMAFTEHEDEAVRRLPSEGTRPRLPWGAGVPRLKEDPGPGLALIERLRHDPSDTVRRSVANHLNDISKDHPAVVVETINRWAADDPPVDRRLATHALRTLVKRGDAGALEALGFTTEAAVSVGPFSVSPTRIEMGDRLELEVELRSTASETQRLVVDFVIHHVNASGGLSPKVFKWTTIDLQPGEQVVLRKRRPIQHASTRTYHAGRHRVELLVAGSVVAEGTFDVAV